MCVYFSKICHEYSSIIKIGQEQWALYKKNNKHFWTYLAQFFLEWEMFQIEFVEIIKTHFKDNNFFFENRAVYKIRLKNIVEPGRSRTIKWRMRIACWIPKDTNTYSAYVTLIAFPLYRRLQECASMLSYKYIACLVHVITFNVSVGRPDRASHARVPGIYTWAEEYEDL
jgi:hypothetical protein